MNRTLLSLATLLSLSPLGLGPLAPVAGATPPAAEGVPQFSIAPQLAESKGPLDPFTVLVSMRGVYYTRTATGHGTLRLGTGLKWVSGDSVHIGHISNVWEGARDNIWSVVIQAQELGSTEIRALLRIGDGDRIDEKEVVLPIEVESTGIRAGLSRTVRAETLRRGQRFRYGGEFLVPIDEPEEVTYIDIKERPRVLVAEHAVCAGCAGHENSIPFVVFVDPQGRIRSHRLLELDGNANGVSSAIIESAEEALSRWKFAPARARSRAVSDWIVVRVNVRK